MIATVSGGLATDARSVGPLEYIRALRLQPEDCYGFLPVELSDGSSIVYVYRDRPEYAAAREGLAGPREARVMFGMVEIQHPVEVDLSGATPPAGEGAIVSHRLYPAIRTRSSGPQLGHFRPRYRMRSGCGRRMSTAFTPAGAITSAGPPRASGTRTGSSTAIAPSTRRAGSATPRRPTAGVAGPKRGGRPQGNVQGNERGRKQPFSDFR